MERDARRSRGQWRGCHTFRDIVCDGDQSFISPKRTGGLRMGQTYYYYYEIDGSTETHDPAMPSTTSCPYLPGQTVNTLDVPTEHPSRHRSASMTSITAADYRTMNPMDKFRSPRPAPTVPGMARSLVSSSPTEALQLHKPLPTPEASQPQRPSRSQSPTPRWISARRLFGLKPSNRGSSADRSKGAIQSDTSDTASVKSSHSNHSSQSYPSERNTRSTTPSGGSRSRDMSPEALRRFLSDDIPVVTTPPVETNIGLSIPEQIMEENEDDDNFASHAAAEVAPSTLLSPPPFLRSFSSPSITSCLNVSSDTIVPQQEPSTTVRHSHSTAFKLHIPKSRFSLSSSSSAITMPFSPTSSISRDSHSSRSSRGASSSSYFGGDNDEDDEEDDLDDRRLSREDEKLGKEQPFAGYSLPPQTTAEAGQKHHRDASVVTQTGDLPTIGSPQFLARSDNGLPLCNNTTLLNLPTIDAGLDDLSSDAGWMADIIRPRE
ncbi:uncharacterized protein PG986_008431 [Apiospora aurea]|uniref:Uncharacterized protein n=1 Tax=Apiospora aurea TaxID=335848 RepID=A0ABR1QFE2_9PEZI